MTRDEFFAMVKDLHEHPEHLPEYRKNYTNIYPFSDGVFKMLMANEAKPERTVKFLNAMLDLNGENAIKYFSFGVPENPGVLNDKTAIFDIYGTTEAGNPVLIEVQQNFNTLFVDRLIYYTSRVISRTVKKSQDYNLPHICVLSLLTEKFFAIDDRTEPEKREKTNRAEMLRIFRAVLEEKEIPAEKLKRLLDKDFAKDVSLNGYTDETLLNEVGGMTNLLYEKQGSRLEGILEGKIETAKILFKAGKLTVEDAVALLHISKEEVLSWKR